MESYIEIIYKKMSGTNILTRQMNKEMRFLRAWIQTLIKKQFKNKKYQKMYIQKDYIDMNYSIGSKTSLK